MGRRRQKMSEQDKFDRIARLTGTIAQLETYLPFFESQGIETPDGCWIARYQVRQGQTIYYYYKRQAVFPIFEQKNAQSLSKYQHLGKAGTQAHVDAVMGVFRRTIVTELRKTIDSLKGCLVDLAFDGEQESK
ncbi:transposase [Candidatus Gracilibacteria bacterium]|nr:transposase [Candidatus Gracilibacteria bacterium]NJM87778.1 transposase [Hydrococcus sp. RU_2_2]NJP18422.1 transposase [Hydrococcus sp. CRU_1_1]